MGDSKLPEIGALETLVGTETYRERMRETLEDDAVEIADLLEAASTILYHQGRLASDDQTISSNVLLGLSEVLNDQANRARAMGEIIQYLSRQPEVVTPGLTVAIPKASHENAERASRK
jgi:hypothetical protein